MDHLVKWVQSEFISSDVWETLKDYVSPELFPVTTPAPSSSSTASAPSGDGNVQLNEKGKLNCYSNRVSV